MGMNALGWSLERARDYLRRHSGMDEAEILSMRAALGGRFVKEFHAAVLGAGALPLPDPCWYIAHETGRLAGGHHGPR